MCSYSLSHPWSSYFTVICKLRTLLFFLSLSCAVCFCDLCFLTAVLRVALHRSVLSDWEGAWQCALIQSDTGLILKFYEISMTTAYATPPLPIRKKKYYLLSRNQEAQGYGHLKDSFVTIGRIFEVWGQISGWE